MPISSFFKDEYVKNHFLTNPAWKKVFLENFPDWTAETYLKQAQKIFENNGYSFVIDKEMKSERVGHLVRMDLHGPITKENSDGFIFGEDWRQNPDAIPQIIITSICEYYVDFTDWK